jgi:uncharacterized protein (TIGR03435 family)
MATLRLGRLTFITNVLLVGFAAVAVPKVTGQINAAEADKKPEFEVASIRPHQAALRTTWFDFTATADGVNATGITLVKLIRNAYGIRNFPTDDRVAALPDWAKSEMYDVHAKMADSDIAEFQKLSNDQQSERRRLMLQLLLEERCKLKLHHETGQRPIYALVVAKDGPKMKEAKPGETYPGGIKGEDGKPVVGGALNFVRTGSVTAQLFSMSNFASFLNSPAIGLERPVVDKTSLTGTYDFTLLFKPDQVGSAEATSSDDTRPSIFTALQEQLGLRLEPTKGSVDVLVVDHLERPSEN